MDHIKVFKMIYFLHSTFSQFKFRIFFSDDLNGE